MVTEDYVSYETARLLRDKGFDGPCYACYEYFKSNVTLYSGWPFEYKGVPVHNSNDRIKCPTLQMAMKWLREVHNLFIWVSCNPKKGLKWYYEVFRTDISNNFVVHIDENNFGTYELTCEAAIKYCLEYLTV